MINISQMKSIAFTWKLHTNSVLFYDEINKTIGKLIDNDHLNLGLLTLLPKHS